MDKISITRTKNAITGSILAFPVRQSRIRTIAKEWKIHTKLIVVLSLLFFPIVFAFIMSTQSTMQIYDIHDIYPGTHLITNYHEVLIEWQFARLFVNTMIFASIVTIVSLIVGLLAAFALVYYDFPLRRIAFVGILLTLLLPVPVRLVPLYGMMVDLNWHNTMYGLIFPFLAWATAVFLFRQHFISLPSSYGDIVKLEGVKPLAFLYLVLVPLSRGMIAGVTAIVFIGAWNAYLWPLVIIDEYERQVIQVGISFLQEADAGAFQQWELLMAGSIIGLIPPLLVLILLRKPLLKSFGVR